GGGGPDQLEGGAGADSFIFRSEVEIGGGDTGLGRDVVLDFLEGVDRLDLSGIDAKAAGGTANDAFTFIGTDDFSAHARAGLLRFLQVDAPDDSDDRTYVEGDTDGDDVADFRLELVGLHSLTAGDFVL